jgi:hypothetical protein
VGSGKIFIKVSFDGKKSSVLKREYYTPYITPYPLMGRKGGDEVDELNSIC